jgi:hypothetical protein
MEVFPIMFGSVAALLCFVRLGSILQALKEIRDELRK